MTSVGASQLPSPSGQRAPGVGGAAQPLQLGDAGLQPGVVSRVHDGTHLGAWIQRVAHDQVAQHGADPVDEFVVDLGRHQQATQRPAPLAVEGGEQSGDASGRLVQVGIGHDHHGAVAAQFELRRLESLGAGVGHGLAAPDAAGEADRPNPVVAHQCLCHWRAAVHELDHAGVEPDRVGGFGQDRRTVGRPFGWLDDDRAAGRRARWPSCGQPSAPVRSTGTAGAPGPIPTGGPRPRCRCRP